MSKCTIALGLLLRNEWPHRKLFLDAGYKAVFAHFWQKAHIYPEVNIVQTQPTTWAYTLHAHLSLFRAFLKSKSTHIMLCSDTCVPIATHDDARERLVKSVSYFTVPELFASHPKRKDAPPFMPYLKAEQWAIYSKEAAACIVKEWYMFIRLYGKLIGGNEIAGASWLLKNQLPVEQVNGVYTEWEAGITHPKTFTDLEALKRKAQGYVTARKYIKNDAPNS